ncbi:myocardin-related transcription factor A-like isoform X2 [Salarias fasciatus]|uniref:myocardin-related transcription factor A-like isoform X2 n=1 Tax=Salarias fasciatus TaxID=181472 RepID=UPI001176B7B5|nr:myocardin-related transcription factor A-like isoform X2 [Salarias fasciatus]
MLEHLPCVRINPAHFRPQPIGSNMDERAIRFELERQACQSLRQVLQLKLQQRRTREELVNQGIMPPLKSSAAFHEQRRSLERARTEDYLKRKIKSRPEKSELIRMHILEESQTEPLLQAKQLQLKRARLVDNLNDKIAHRPGPMELIHKNILPVHSSIKQAITETRFSKPSGGNSSCDEDSNGSLSPGQPVSQECPLALGPDPSPAEALAGNSLPSPAQEPPPARPLPLASGSPTSLRPTSGKAVGSAQRTTVHAHIKPKPNSTQKHKKAKDNKPKVKKLKYHQYIPPDQKGDKEPPPHLDSSYAKILQQQQLFLQLQILSQQQQQQQHYNYHTILPAPPKPQSDQLPPSSSPTSSSILSTSSSSSSSSSSPPQPATATSTSVSNQQGNNCGSAAALAGAKPASLPSNLDEMKVAELKCELKLRGLPLSGTKNDLIERLRTYQELNGGSDTTSPPTAGGTTGPGAEAAAASPNKNTSAQQKTQCHNTSLYSADATPPAAAPKQLMTCGGTVVPPPVSPFTPSNRSPTSPEDSSFSSEPLGGLMSSPLTQLGLEPSSTAQLQAHIKDEPTCSAPAPCQFSLKSSSQKKHCLVSSAAHAVGTSAPAVAIDKDKMLQEKDKQIEELTRMLMQKQRLVELLKRQLEHGNREARVSEPLILVRVKEEPPDKPSAAHSTSRPPIQASSDSRELDVAKVAVKEEVLEDTTVPSDSEALLQPLGQTELQVQLKPEQKNEYICLKQTALQFAQQQAIQKLLLQRQQQQQSIQKQQQTVQKPNPLPVNHQNLQKLCQQKKKKLQKLQLKQQQAQERAPHEQQQHSKLLQQMQLKQQILLKQQKSLLQQHLKQQQQSKQLQQIQIQTKVHVKQQQIQLQQNQNQEQQQQQQQQQPAQVSQAYFNQHSAFPLDLLKSDSTPTLVTDSNGNHFLIALTSHINGNQNVETSEGKAANHITLQTHNGGLQVPADQPQQGAAQCLSAPPTLPSFLKDQDAAPSGKNTSPPSSQADVCHSFDALFSPLSPASIQTATSSSDDKQDTEHEEDFIDAIMQTGAPTPIPSPLHQLLSPPFPQPDRSEQPEPPAPDFLREERQHPSRAASGRLEDFLESTTGKPLLGVEPGGLLTVIDDLNSQMLCTPSILDHLPSPMDTFDMVAEDEQGLDNMDWLDFTMEKEKEQEIPALAPLGPQTPPSVFSTDFLDSYDLYIHWDSCL